MRERVKERDGGKGRGGGRAQDAHADTRGDNSNGPYPKVDSEISYGERSRYERPPSLSSQSSNGEKRQDGKDGRKEGRQEGSSARARGGTRSGAA